MRGSASFGKASPMTMCLPGRNTRKFARAGKATMNRSGIRANGPYVKKTTEWRPGPVLLKVPNNNWIGGLREDLDDFSMDDEV
jgi:hypothetical protein